MAVRKPPTINATQTADMAFIMLCFFLMVTTMGSEFGLIRQLPPWTDDSGEEQIRERNVFVVNVNQHNVIGVRGMPIDISQLREATKDFLYIGNTGDNFPEKEVREIPGIGNVNVNMGAVISLANQRGTSYRTYIQVQNELAAAINELRDEFSMQRFGIRFENLSEELQDAISRQIYPMAISEQDPREDF